MIEDQKKRLMISALFEDVVRLCIEHKDFVEQFDRLNNTQVSKLHYQSPIEKMIDEVTGFQKDQLFKFFDFVRDYVFLPFISGKTDYL